MTSFLFWNIFKKPLQNRIANLVKSNQVDVLMLAECEIDAEVLLESINGADGRPYCEPISESKQIRVFTRLDESALTDQLTNPGRLTIRRLKTGDPPGVLLAVLHFQSRLAWTTEEQALEATVLARDIAQAEDQVGHRRTILVGDLNMNPFDLGVVGAQALNAVMTKKLARRVDRMVAGRPYRCFYNPMWGYFGDRDEEPPGTFFYPGSNPGNFFWHMFDQVMLRPDLMEKLEDLRILDHDGNTPLITKHGRPRKADGSDHLPIFFQLDL